MITIKVTFDTRTAMGLTNCNAEKAIFRDYRDVENVEEAVEYVSKLFANKSFSNQYVDFIFSNDTMYGCTTDRYFRFYSDKITHVRFLGKSEGTKEELDKLTTKTIREAYLICADMAIDYETKKAEATA